MTDGRQSDPWKRTRPRRRFDVALAGYYGFGNLGDELLAAALIRNLELLGIPRERMVLLSADPSRSKEEFGVACVQRWSLAALWATFRESETLLLGGGGLFQDATSLRSCLYYWAVVRLAARAGCRPWAFGQSVGPFRRSTAARLTKNALRLCVYRGVRDEPSLELLHAWNLEGTLVPDPVLSLDVRKCSGEEALLVNLRPWRNDLPLRAARACAELARAYSLPVVGVALAREDEDLLASFSAQGILPCRHILRVRSLSDASGAWCAGRFAVGMRLHFVMLSAMFCRAVTAIPYDPKVEAFARSRDMACWYGEGEIPFPEPCRCGTKSGAAEVTARLEEAWSLLGVKSGDGRPM
jgi:polysaccharide pyruvyl transferase CsaB